MRVLSWNIQYGRGVDGRVDLRRTAAVIHAHDPDIVCLQEVAVNHPGLPGMADGFIDQVAVLSGLFTGFAAVYAVACDLPDGLGGRRTFGNMVLSRLPLGQVFRHALPFPSDPTVPGMARGLLEAVVQCGFGALRIMTTHLEYYSVAQRTAQLTAIARIYREGWEQARSPHSSADADPPFAVLPRGEFAIVCGDFNCPPDAPENAALAAGATGAMAAPALRDAWSVVHRETPHAWTAGRLASDYFPQLVCFDRAYFSDNLIPRLRDVRVDAVADASDHQPLVCDIDETP